MSCATAQRAAPTRSDGCTSATKRSPRRPWEDGGGGDRSPRRPHATAIIMRTLAAMADAEMTDFSAAQKLLESTNLSELCKKVGRAAQRRCAV